MNNRLKKLIFTISIIINVLITIPFLILFIFNANIQYIFYQDILLPNLGKPSIVFIGDSITRNGGLWAFKIGQGYNFNTLNFGQASFSTRQLRHTAKKVAMVHPKYAFIMAGINDEDKSSKGVKKTFTYYKQILDILQKANVEPIIELTLYRENEQSPEFITELNRQLLEYGANHGISIINLNTILCPNKSLLPKYTSDGVHLTRAAYKVWALEVKKLLKNKQQP